MDQLSRACGWCGTVNLGPRTNCVSCAGPLPMPPGQDPGPPPPPAPRHMPGSYRLKKLVWGNLGVMLGVLFTGIGVVFSFSFCLASFLLPPMCLGSLGGVLFMIPGLAVGVPSLRAAQRALAAYANGVHADGQIVRVSEDTSTAVNGRHPWRVDYVFEAGGATVGGSVSCFDPVHATRRPGQPVHVVYLPDRPSVNAIWPPPA